MDLTVGGVYERRMRGQWLNWLRSRRRGVVNLLIAAFLVPMLFAALPDAGLSAAAALDRDVAQSYCDISGLEKPGSLPADHLKHDCCILCSTGFLTSSPQDLLEGLAFEAVPQDEPSIPETETSGQPPAAIVLLSGSPPQGPPSVSLI